MSVHKFLIFLGLLSCAFACSQAQTSNADPRHDLEVFAGYSYLVSSPNTLAGTDLPSGSGFNAGLDFRIYRRFSVLGEISLYPISCNCPAASKPNETTFLFGPRYSFPLPKSSRFTPFADLLIGGSTYSNTSNRDGYIYNNNNSFAFDVGGGLDYRLTPHFATRCRRLCAQHPGYRRWRRGTHRIRAWTV